MHSRFAHVEVTSKLNRIGRNMTKVLIKVKVAYTGEFQKVFNSQAATRQRGGERSCRLCSDDSIHNLIYAILGWESVQSAQSFWVTQAAKTLMKAWHCVGAPQITILRKSPA